MPFVRSLDSMKHARASVMLATAWALALPTSAGVGSAGCAGTSQRAPFAEPCAGPGCGGGATFTGGAGGADTGTDGAGADVLPGGDAARPGEFAVTGPVRVLTTFVGEPSAGAQPTAEISVSGTRVDGSTLTSLLDSGGNYSLAGIARVDPITWVRVSDKSSIRTLVGLLASTSPAPLPLFTQDVAAVTVARVGLATSVLGLASIVVRVVNATGLPLAGARLSSNAAGPSAGDPLNCLDRRRARACGPFYDDGSDVAPGGVATRGRGVGVYLAIDTVVLPAFDVTVRVEGKAPVVLAAIPRSGDAISFVQVAIP